MKLLWLAIYAVSYSAFADFKLDTKYVLVDRYCSDGSDAGDVELKRILGAMMEYGSDGKYTVFDEPQNFQGEFRKEDNVLIRINYTTDKLEIRSVLRNTQRGFLQFSELPANQEYAKKICPNGGKVVSAWEERTTQE